MKNVAINIQGSEKAGKKAQGTLEEVARSNNSLAQAMIALAQSNKSIADAAASVFGTPSHVTITGCHINMGMKPEAVIFEGDEAEENDGENIFDSSEDVEDEHEETDEEDDD